MVRLDTKMRSFSLWDLRREKTRVGHPVCTHSQHGSKYLYAYRKFITVVMRRHVICSTISTALLSHHRLRVRDDVTPCSVFTCATAESRRRYRSKSNKRVNHG